jgi:hypothetical protein
MTVLLVLFTFILFLGIDWLRTRYGCTREFTSFYGGEKIEIEIDYEI